MSCEYFFTRDNVEAYLQMLEGYDNRFMTDLLRSRLPIGLSVLELGMGSGLDLLDLSSDYRVTGSDSSSIFLDLFQKKHTDIELLQLDAVTLKTDRQFDCLFSNKVLMHLRKEEMVHSLIRQRELLKDKGVLIHSFWYGDGVEEFDGLYFQYYTEESLQEVVFAAGLLIKDIGRYTEEETDDSLFLVMTVS